MKLDVVFAGVGGQGIVVASDILCQAALLDGFVVAKSEIHGIAKRGGSIDAHVRIGTQICTPMIERGTCDVIVGFELLEAARALPMLKSNGKVVVNSKLLQPTATLQETAKPIQSDELTQILRQRASQVHLLDAEALAAKAGNVQSLNVVLLGALLAASGLCLSKESLRLALSSRFSEKAVTINLAALQLGEEALKV